MNIYKKLAGQTFIYGLGTIVPKILNYSILTVYYTRLFPVEEFGVITELYAYVTFLMILLTYGTETGFFRFSRDKESEGLYSSLIISLLTTSLFFIIVIGLSVDKVALALKYKDNEKYIMLMAGIIAIDAFSSIPFARLRMLEKALRFSLLKVVNVAVTIVAVLFFYEIAPVLQQRYGILNSITSEGNIVFVLVSNLIASSAILLLLLPDIIKQKFVFNWPLLKNVLAYSFPLLIAGLAGTINETLDRVLLKHLVEPADNAMYILGIYGANYRIGVLLFICIQMFRYAVEPFYFNYYGKKDEQIVFARIMRLFLGISVVLSMIIIFYLKYFKFFIDIRYHEGLGIVPVILLAYIFYGIFFNQSIWYKLQKKTGYAILLTLVGATVTIIANVVFVKYYSYYASAYGHVFAYFIMMILSYFIGRKYYKINYRLNLVVEYSVVAIVIFAIKFYLATNGILEDALSLLLIILYCAYILWREDLLSINKLKQWKLK